MFSLPMFILLCRWIYNKKMAMHSGFTQANDPISVWICGHSFVTRLQSFCYDNYETHGNMGFVPESHLVFYKSRSGGITTHLKQDMKIAAQVDADLVIIDIGTNDLDSSCVPPDVLAKNVFEDAKLLLQKYQHVKMVIILECLFRSVKGRHAPKNPNFVADAHRYNNKLKLLVKDQPDRDNAPIRFWHHRGLVHNWPSYLCDGVHLTQDGMQKYQKSIRRAILKWSPFVRAARASAT